MSILEEYGAFNVCFSFAMIFRLQLNHSTLFICFQYVVIGYKDTYFVRDHSDAPQKYSDADVIKMLEYLIDNIFVEFGGQIFEQNNSISPTDI